VLSREEGGIWEFVSAFDVFEIVRRGGGGGEDDRKQNGIIAGLHLGWLRPLRLMFRPVYMQLAATIRDHQCFPTQELISNAVNNGLDMFLG
jgi:hypothetical protein